MEVQDSVEKFDDYIEPEEPKKAIDPRFRNAACIVYEESASENWFSILSDWKIPALVSPRHDVDINPDGTLKKAHYHVLVSIEGKKSEAQFREIFKSFGGVGCERVQSLRGYSRYLCHLDNPEKAQYNVAEIRAFGGASFFEYTTLPTDVAREIKFMQQFIRREKISSYSKFLDICASDFPDWHYLVISRCNSVIKEYMHSICWDIKAEVEAKKKLEEKLKE